MKFSTSAVVLRFAILSSFSITAMTEARLAEGNGIFSDGGGDHAHETWETRIVGGKRAARDEYPYFVSWGGCGASLIAPDVILSAAHCDGGVFTNSVVVGAYQRWWGQTSGSAQRRSIVDRVVHPGYDSSSLANDFMIMKLNNPVDIPIININADPEFPSDDDATLTVIGFGSVFEGGWGPRLLQEVDVQYVSQEQCNKEYDGDIIEDVMLCAGVAGGGSDSCQGDSGGPIVQKVDDDLHIQVGVVSWGRGCAREGYSGVYSRTSGAKDWLKSKICELSADPPAYIDCSNDSLSVQVNQVEPTEEEEIIPVPSLGGDEEETVPSLEDEETSPVVAEERNDNEECVDSETLVFETDNINGVKGCDWLRANPEYNYLCKFTDVTVTCPVLCDTCDELFNE